MLGGSETHAFCLSGERNMNTFTATIIKLGINPCVDVPAPIVAILLREARQEHAPVQVRGTIDDRTPFATNVVVFRGVHRLYLNTEMRQAAGVNVGDTVTIALAYDPVVRELPMPDPLRAALVENGVAAARWRRLSNSRRKEILAYLNSLKTEAGLARNVRRTIKGLVRPTD